MQYRCGKDGVPISLLGYGCMRFTKKGGHIDLDKAEKEILHAIELGVNYFDTAYIYPGSEVALGEILHRNHCRDQVMIATKLPQYLIKSYQALDKFFFEQCKRLKTDWIDYYLLHMLTDIAEWEKLVQLGILSWIEQKKQEGKIKKIGFSFHGNSEMFLKILDAYDWDFCMIQYNYLDEHTQAGRKGLLAAGQKGIPVIIMEPLRGGKLIHNLPSAALNLIKADKKQRTPAALAFEWLFDQPDVTCVLSGMNSIEMLEENCQIAELLPNTFTQEDHSLIEGIQTEIRKVTQVPCTSCGYCMPCPKGIDIPAAFQCYNRMYLESKGSGQKEYFQTTALQKSWKPLSDCIDCNKCVSHCPQQIAIPKLLKKADKELTPWYYKLGIQIAHRFLSFK